MEPREAKCSTLRTSCAGQAALTQYQATSPSKCSTGSPHSGHFLGGVYLRSRPVRASVNRPNHVGDHLAGALDQHAVADADVLLGM